MKIDGVQILCDLDVETALRQMFNKTADDLGLSTKAIEKFEKTINEDVAFIKKGKKPSTIIGARIYLITLLIGEPRTQKKVVWVTKSCEASIREMYKLMTGRGKLNVRNRSKLNG